MIDFFNYILSLTADLGYLGIVFLMAIESTFVPLPSELVIPPAAYLASQGQMNIYVVIISGAVGSVLGACFNYFLALTLGRKLIYFLAGTKIARFFLVNEEKVKKVEIYFNKNSDYSTFIGRLIPGVRHLISIPAGFSQMDFKKFLLFTFLGSGLWTAILAVLGYFFGENQELLMRYFHEISIAMVVLGILFVVYLFLRNRKNLNNS